MLSYLIVLFDRKQTASPTPPQNSQNSTKESWPCTFQNQKESRTSRSKDSQQSQRTEGKSSRSKNKHTSEGQKRFSLFFLLIA